MEIDPTSTEMNKSSALTAEAAVEQKVALAEAALQLTVLKTVQKEMDNQATVLTESQRQQVTKRAQIWYLSAKHVKWRTR